MLLNPRIKSASMNILKNSIQYSIGAVVYFLTFGSFFLLKFSLGLLGFLIAYSSVYQYNDLMDYEDDRRNDVKRYLKPLASGKIGRKDAESYSFLFMLVGLSICFFVSLYIGLMVSVLLFLNFLHSSHFTRLKKTRLLLPNLFLVEFVKYSLGWFVMSLTLSEFPFLLIAFVSSIYLIGYLYHKQNFKNFFCFRISSMCIISSVLYMLCLFFFQFSLVLLILLPLSLCFFALNRIRSGISKYKAGLTLTQLAGFCFILSLFLLMVPTVAEVNSDLNNRLDAVKENVTSIIPQDIKSGLSDINNTIVNGINKISEDEDFLKLDSFFYRNFDFK